MSLEANKALVRRFVDEVIGAGSEAAIEELVAAEYVELRSARHAAAARGRADACAAYVNASA
jgi:hypothetical protein